MSKTISISDRVYELLKREKGDRSFSEVIADQVEGGGRIADIAGMQLLDEGTMAQVKQDIEEGSKGTMERLA